MAVAVAGGTLRVGVTTPLPLPLPPADSVRLWVGVGEAEAELEEVEAGAVVEVVEAAVLVVAEVVAVGEVPLPFGPALSAAFKLPLLHVPLPPELLLRSCLPEEGVEAEAEAEGGAVVVEPERVSFCMSKFAKRDAPIICCPTNTQPPPQPQPQPHPHHITSHHITSHHIRRGKYQCMCECTSEQRQTYAFTLLRLHHTLCGMRQRFFNGLFRRLTFATRQKVSEILSPITNKTESR